MSDPDLTKFERDAYLQTLHHIASLAHEGGHLGTEWDVLNYIRALTKPHFVADDSKANRLYRLGNAVNAAERMA